MIEIRKALCTSRGVGVALLRRMGNISKNHPILYINFELRRCRFKNTALTFIVYVYFLFSFSRDTVRELSSLRSQTPYF